MSIDGQEPCAWIDRHTLTRWVQEILGRDDVEVGEWDCEIVTGGAEQTTALYRLAGEVAISEGPQPWSLILKTHSLAPEHNDPEGVWYWKREARVYESGLLDELPGGLRAPRCFGMIERPDGAQWIRMEEVQDDVGDWDLEDYGRVARCLGQLNGAYVMGEPLPVAPWLSRRWLRQYIERIEPALNLLLDHFDEPLMRRAMPSLTRESLQTRWEQRYVFLDAIEGLPQTFCHLDAIRRNLFLRKTEGDHEPVAVDWSYCGIASLGEEIVPLAFGSVTMGDVDLGDALLLEEIVLREYLAGLRDAGWDGDPDRVRFSYLATAYWRYMFGAGIGEIIPVMVDPRYHARFEKVFGMSMEDCADFFAVTVSLFERVYEEASALKTELAL